MSNRKTAFDAITKDKPTLAGFLRSLPCIEAPWDAAFQKLLLFLHGGELRRLRE